MSYAGLDFGTSNSAIGFVNGKEVNLVHFNDKSTLPSAIFFDFEEDETLFGYEAMEAYIEGVNGRLLRALKSILGTELMGQKTQVKRNYYGFDDILVSYLTHMKKRAEKQAGKSLTKAVFGRPVHFIDDDEIADKEAENQLREIGKRIGFEEIEFMKEPEAAAYEFAHKVRKNLKAVIIDIGGGTADFSVIETFEDAKVNVLANTGVHIGGTDVDKILSLQEVMPHLGLGLGMKDHADLKMPVHLYHDLATWYKIPFLYDEKTLDILRQKKRQVSTAKPLERFEFVVGHQLGHKLAAEVESVKVSLSSGTEVAEEIDFIEPKFSLDIHQSNFEMALNQPTDALKETLLKALKIASVDTNDIEAIFFTGGTSHIPYIRERLASELPCAKVVEGDMFASVARGLVLKAQELYG